jgi:hypothetical protein
MEVKADVESIETKEKSTMKEIKEREISVI